jgi:sugar phosphate isomerase/epimerase
MTPSLIDPHLVLAWGTVRHATFPDRVAAAAEAGFDSIGMMIGNYLKLREQGWSDSELLAVLRDHDVTLDEVEVLFGFFATPRPADLADRPGLIYADPAVEEGAFHLADVFGARRVQAVGTFDDTPVGPEVIDAFGDLCDRADKHGLQVALEFLPYSNIPDLGTAIKIVAAADRPNGGLCIDSWHVFRGATDLDALAATDSIKIFMIQINDGPTSPTDANRRVDAVHHRQCPGDGDFALDEFLTAVQGPGLEPVVSVEVYSDALDRLPTAEAAHRAAVSTRKVLSRLGDEVITLR